ncbi:uncharacterized protein LOC124505324 [Lynx rufus]|uniref:uncharacterized protein LOC124505324 n=1 Tax=Lynx rufus TaxID=61384 RepID=UPI001F126A46|nr:uncharacterized protein LOC124505324 [Lynx rufus]
MTDRAATEKEEAPEVLRCFGYSKVGQVEGRQRLGLCDLKFLNRSDPRCPCGFRGIPPAGAERPVVGLDALGRARRRGPRLERSASHPSGAFRGGAPNVDSGRGAGAARGSPHSPPPGVRGGRSLVGLAKRTGPVPALRRVCNPMDTQKCTEEKSRKGCVKCREVRHEATRRRLFCKGCVTLPRHGESDLCYSEVHLRLLQGADGTSREEDQRQPGARGQSDEHTGHQTDYKSLLVLLSYFCLLFSPTTLPSTCLFSLSPHPSIFRSISLSSLSFERQSEEEIYYVIKELPEDACIFPVRL